MPCADKADHRIYHIALMRCGNGIRNDIAEKVALRHAEHIAVRREQHIGKSVSVGIRKNAVAGDIRRTQEAFGVFPAGKYFLHDIFVICGYVTVAGHVARYDDDKRIRKTALAVVKDKPVARGDDPVLIKHIGTAQFRRTVHGKEGAEPFVRYPRGNTYDKAGIPIDGDPAFPSEGYHVIPHDNCAFCRKAFAVRGCRLRTDGVCPGAYRLDNAAFGNRNAVITAVIGNRNRVRTERKVCKTELYRFADIHVAFRDDEFDSRHPRDDGKGDLRITPAGQYRGKGMPADIRNERAACRGNAVDIAGSAGVFKRYSVAVNSAMCGRYDIRPAEHRLAQRRINNVYAVPDNDGDPVSFTAAAAASGVKCLPAWAASGRLKSPLFVTAQLPAAAIILFSETDIFSSVAGSYTWRPTVTASATQSCSPAAGTEAISSIPAPYA